MERWIKTHQAPTLLRAFLLILVGTIVLSGCTLRDKNFGKIPYFGPHDPYPSPFEVRKVRLSSDSSEGNGSETSDSAAQPAEGGREIVVIVKNECIEAECSGTPAVADTLSCYIYSHPARVAERKTQFVPLTSVATDEQLEDQIDNPIDEKCIVGITNNVEHEIKSFNDTFYTDHQRPYLDVVKFEQSLPYFNAVNLSPVKVAIIDTGVGLHSDLSEGDAAPRVVWRQDVRSYASKNTEGCGPYTNENPSNTHGTFVAGIVAADQDNNLGIAGVAKNAEIYSFAVGNCYGRMKTSEIGDALMESIEHEVEVVNLSLGGATGDDLGIRHGILALLNTKAVVVVSAGNSYLDLDGDIYRSYPATYAPQYPGLITVAWGTVDGDLVHGSGPHSGGSNYGPEHVKILAPGTQIASSVNPSGSYNPVDLTADPDRHFGKGQGSSFSAPIVTGAVALAIGYMKASGITYNEQLVEYLIVERAIEKKPNLEDYVKNGGLLSIEELGKILEYMVETGENPSPMVATNSSLHLSGERPELSFTVEWDVPMTHFGARLGLFDATCGFSAPCLIQDYVLTGNTGSHDFTLSRNEALPILSIIGDSTFNLPIAVAIYYKMCNEDGTKCKNNFGIDAVVRLNLRDYNMNLPSTSLLGEVTNIRMDMQNLYIHGWSCLPGYNKVVKMEVVDQNGTAFETSYQYYYPYMFPHGTPIDSYSYSHVGGRFEALGTYKMNAEDKGVMKQVGHTSYGAGVEANPLMIERCKTLTASHGFEFGIPLKKIYDENLKGSEFSIRATSPKDNSTTLLLKDKFENTQFTFPEVNYQESITSSVTLDRTSTTDAISVVGELCSNSPSPIHMEVSFSLWDFKCRLLEDNPPAFPDWANRCSLGIDNGLPMLYDASTDMSDRNTFASYYYNRFVEPFGPLRRLIDLEMTDEEMEDHLGKFPGRWPNAVVSVNAPSSARDAYYTWVVGHPLKEIDSGAALDRIAYGYRKWFDAGENAAVDFGEYRNDRAAVSYMGGSRFWDYIDVGEPYTHSVVAYEWDKEKALGEYLFDTFRVSKLMREIKKYETPLGIVSRVLGHQVVHQAPSSGSCSQHKFSPNWTISEISKLNPFVDGRIKAYLKAGDSDKDYDNIHDDVAWVMQNLPLDIRFFQDGVMILHLLSTFEEDTVRVPNTYRGDPR